MQAFIKANKCSSMSNRWVSITHNFRQDTDPRVRSCRLDVYNGSRADIVDWGNLWETLDIFLWYPGIAWLVLLSELPVQPTVNKIAYEIMEKAKTVYQYLKKLMTWNMTESWCIISNQRWAIPTPESESEPEPAPNFTNLEPESESESTFFPILESESESEPCNYFQVESEPESESECQGGIGIGVGAGTIWNRPSLIVLDIRR